uniref:protein SHQ1 homolog n=1 Tax=Myxine glutinosa TaxID=7769 RepID=UPI003590117F
MITPFFELKQEPDFLSLSIRVPYSRAGDFDISVDGHDFHFYGKPYFLRLNLPGPVVQDGRERAAYDTDSGTLHLKLPKATPGEHFKGLDMLTALLAPRGTRHIPSLPEEIGGDVEEGAESEDEFDWQWKQELYNEHEKDELCLPGCGYGFGNLRSGVFTRLQDELSEVADVKDPDRTFVLERRHARLQAEDAKFDSDHYLADLFECSSFPDLMLYEPWWKLSRKSQLLGLEEDEKLIPFGEEEKEAMLKLPRRKPCLLGQARQEALLGMVDILLAYAYDARTTEGEPTVESPWTIRKLSGTLCWFETFHSLHEVLVCFVRRVVCYPLFRRFDLALQAVADAADILKLGRRASLKALLAVHRLFRQNDPAYILNDLYLTEYCVWIQHLSSKRLKSFGEAVSSEQLCKEELGFDLELLEAAGLATLHEQEQGLSNEAARLQTSQSGTPPSDSDESDSDESTSSDECSDSESSSDGNSDPELTTKVSSNNDCDDVTAVLTQLQLDRPGASCAASDEATARKPLIEELD